MDRHEQLVQNYEDALFALLMESAAKYEGQKLLAELDELNADPGFELPPDMDKRCMRTINAEFAKKKLRRFGKSAYRVFAKASVAAMIVLVLFGSAYAAIPEVRVGARNLLITVSELATELTFEDAGDAPADVPEDEQTADGLTLGGYVLPEVITSDYEVTDEEITKLTVWQQFTGPNGEVVGIDVQEGEGTSVNINTEDALEIRTLESGAFKAIVAEHEISSVAGIADSERVKFIVFTFENVDFDTACAMITEFMEQN